MFYYEIPYFNQDFKSENLSFLNLYSVHAARIVTNGTSVNKFMVMVHQKILE